MVRKNYSLITGYSNYSPRPRDKRGTRATALPPIAMHDKELTHNVKFKLTSLQLLKTGRPVAVWPAFPGVTPPTILVPYSKACAVWKAPCRRKKAVDNPISVSAMTWIT